MKTITMNVPTVSRLPDPNGKHEVNLCYVNVADLPEDFPLDPNPRAQNTKSSVAQEIRLGLEIDPSIFHILNRGITLTASHVEHNRGKLTLTFKKDTDGLLDGGHTYNIIKKYRDEIKDAYVKLEILSGVRPAELVKVAKARNTSAQVQEKSLANLSGEFDWLKNILLKEPFAHKIAWRENEQGKAIDCREVVALITMFHPMFSEDDSPVITYTSKAKCLDLFLSSNEDIQAGYKMLGNIIPEILYLYDHIHAKFAEFYTKLGGYSGILGEQKSQVKLGKVLEVKHYPDGFALHYLNEQAEFAFPDGWLYPVVAAHRALIHARGEQILWRCNPRKFFDKYGANLVKLTLEASHELGRNPNQVGKAKNHWNQLHDKVMTTILRLTKGDEHKTIDI